MPKCFDPRLDVLPLAQKEIWPALSAAPHLSFVLYGGTAIALHLGHRQSVDFDFFRSDPLDRAEAKDYRDIARMISAGVSLPAGLAAFRRMFNGEPAQVLRAIGYFKDGDLSTLPKTDQNLLRSARDQVDELPDVRITPGQLATQFGACEQAGRPK
jgi:hypothetical protein